MTKKHFKLNPQSLRTNINLYYKQQNRHFSGCLSFSSISSRTCECVNIWSSFTSPVWASYWVLIGSKPVVMSQILQVTKWDLMWKQTHELLYLSTWWLCWHYSVFPSVFPPGYWHQPDPFNQFRFCLCSSDEAFKDRPYRSETAESSFHFVPAGFVCNYRFML